MVPAAWTRFTGKMSQNFYYDKIIRFGDIHRSDDHWPRKEEPRSNMDWVRGINTQGHTYTGEQVHWGGNRKDQTYDRLTRRIRYNTYICKTIRSSLWSWGFPLAYRPRYFSLASKLYQFIVLVISVYRFGNFSISSWEFQPSVMGISVFGIGDFRLVSMGFQAM